MHFIKKTHFISAVAFIISLLLIYYVAKNIGNVEVFIHSVGIIGPLVSLALYTILSFTPITTDSLTLINGALYGPLWGSLLSWTGNNFAALTEYYLGKSICAISGFDKNKYKLPFGLSKLPVDSFWFLIFGRLIPGYGGKIVSISGGLCNVPFKKYFWSAIITNLIGAVLLSLIGFGLFKSLGLSR